MLFSATTIIIKFLSFYGDDVIKIRPFHYLKYNINSGRRMSKWIKHLNTGVGITDKYV